MCLLCGDSINSFNQSITVSLKTDIWQKIKEKESCLNLYQENYTNVYTDKAVSVPNSNQGCFKFILEAWCILRGALAKVFNL